MGFLKAYNHEKFWKRYAKLSKGGLFYPVKIWYHWYLIRVQTKNNSYIGFGAKFKTPPTLPHELKGIFISKGSKIGANCVILQQVTIGSNTLKGEEYSPVIGDHCYIGAGAKIIGDITIGDHARIGANCVVVEDIQPHATVVLQKPRVLVRLREKIPAGSV